MHNIRRPAAQYRMVPIQTAERVPLVAALLQEVHVGISEVPAPRTLQNISADGREVANLRRSRLARRVSNRGELRAQPRILRNFAELASRANPHLTRRPELDSRKLFQTLKIHQRRRRGDILLRKIKHIDPARQSRTPILSQQTRSAPKISRHNNFKSIHNNLQGPPPAPIARLLLSALELLPGA